jgi:hypothetical protein
LETSNSKPSKRNKKMLTKKIQTSAVAVIAAILTAALFVGVSIAPAIAPILA